MFKLTAEVLNIYKRLKYDPTANRVFNVVPFGSYVWADEHPGGRCSLPDMDEQSKISILQLAAARTGLWLTDELPKELRDLWDEARHKLPDWPGFKRLSITIGEKEAVREFRTEWLSFEKEVSTGAGQISISKDTPGLVKFTLVCDLTKVRGKKDKYSEDDV